MLSLLQNILPINVVKFTEHQKQNIMNKWRKITKHNVHPRFNLQYSYIWATLFPGFVCGNAHWRCLKCISCEQQCRFTLEWTFSVKDYKLLYSFIRVLLMMYIFTCEQLCEAHDVNYQKELYFTVCYNGLTDRHMVQWETK